MIYLVKLGSTPALLDTRRNRPYCNKIGRPMKAQEITDVLIVRDILAANTSAAETIAALVDWKNGNEPAAQRTNVVHSDEVAESDAEPELPAPVKKAPAKAPTKAPAKPKAKPPVADDDDADF